jgi:hypothetical protein
MQFFAALEASVVTTFDWMIGPSISGNIEGDGMARARTQQECTERSSERRLGCSSQNIMSILRNGSGGR